MNEAIANLYISMQQMGLYQAPGFVIIGIVVLIMTVSWKSKASLTMWIALFFCISWGMGLKHAHDRNEWLTSQLPLPPQTEFRFHAEYDDHESWSLKVNPVVVMSELIKFYVQVLPIHGWTLAQQGDCSLGPVAVLKKGDQVFLIIAKPDRSYLENQGPELTYDLYSPAAFKATYDRLQIKAIDQLPT